MSITLSLFTYIDICGISVRLGRTKEGAYYLVRGEKEQALNSWEAYNMARIWGNEEGLTALGFEPKEELELPKQLRSFKFEIPEGAPNELVEAAVRYAEKFIPLMILENMAARKNYLRQLDVETINKQWAAWTENFVNGTLGENQ